MLYAFFSSQVDSHAAHIARLAWNKFFSAGYNYSTHKAAKKVYPALLPTSEIGKLGHICTEELNAINYINARDELLKVIRMKKDPNNIRILMVVIECFNHAFYNISEVRVPIRNIWNLNRSPWPQFKFYLQLFDFCIRNKNF